MEVIDQLAFGVWHGNRRDRLRDRTAISLRSVQTIKFLQLFSGQIMLRQLARQFSFPAFWQSKLVSDKPNILVSSTFPLEESRQPKESHQQ